MSRTIAGLESERSRLFSWALASAGECARRAEASLEDLGGASNILLLSGLGASLIAGYITGLMAEHAGQLASVAHGVDPA